MGQSTSSQRDREDFLYRDSRRLSQILQEREFTDGQSTRVWPSSPRNTEPETPTTSSRIQESRSSRPIAAFSRQISAQSIPVLRGGAGNSRDISTRDEIFYEQHEERPLSDIENPGMQNTPVTHITASPMPRRSSRMARLSSRIMPRYATSGDQDDGQHNRGEGRSLRRRLSNTDPSSTTNELGDHRSRRLSFFDSLMPNSSTNSSPRRPRELATISRPFPLSPDGLLPSSGFRQNPLRDALPSRTLTTGPNSPPSRLLSISRGARLSRIRRSISTPFEAFFPSQNAPSPDYGRQPPPQRPSRLTPTHDYDFLLPPLDATDPSIDLNSPGPEPSPVDSEQRASGFAPRPESPERGMTRTESASWTERWTERGSGGRREGRRMPGMLRGRSSRLIRRDNDGPLPRILHLAATAIAAQLSGTSEQPVPDMQAIGPDDLDGSLNNLFRTLQHVTSQTGDTQIHDGLQDSTRPLGSLPPLNFLRVFRFVSQTSTTRASNPASDTERLGGRIRVDNQSAIDENVAVDTEGRTVTLVVVGVRSVPSDNIGHEGAAARDPNLESLLNFSPLASANSLSQEAGGLLRHGNGRSRFPHRRRASISGLNTTPANYDIQRHQRILSPNRQDSAESPHSGPAHPPALSESPPGPNPPPSTPADLGISAYSSAATTPSRRPSSASAIHQPPMPARDQAVQSSHELGLSDSEDQATRVQHRRRSDSEFARHRDLGAGAARRNGVVEPDEVDASDIPTPGSRSWLIYVVGTNLSEDHPALTTPSLFTDNPTYEDMLLLSSLLGPAKPPVASDEDVASALGTYCIKRSSNKLIAEATRGMSHIEIGPSECCLVCLEEYQAEEEVRQLKKCSHLFHRDCIDLWLTTGRNSCPLCRGQGVDEHKEARQERPASSSPRLSLVS